MVSAANDASHAMCLSAVVLALFVAGHAQAEPGKLKGKVKSSGDSTDKTLPGQPGTDDSATGEKRMHKDITVTKDVEVKKPVQKVAEPKAAEKTVIDPKETSRSINESGVSIKNDPKKKK